MVLRIKEREEPMQLWTPRSMVNYSCFIGRAIGLMQKPSMIESSSGRAPKKAPRWDLKGSEGCGRGKVFLWMPILVWGYVGIYRQKNQARRCTRGPQGWGARPTPLACPPPLWPPRGFPDLHSKSSGCLLVQEKSSIKFHSLWTPFGIPFLRNSKTRKKQDLALGSRLIGQSPK